MRVRAVIEPLGLRVSASHYVIDAVADLGLAALVVFWCDQTYAFEG